MGRNILIFIGVLMTVQVWSQSSNTNPAGYKKYNNTSFDLGEELEFKVTFGWFTVGSATLKIKDKFETYNNRICYKVDIYAKTAGWVDWLAKVDDHWGAYIDKEAMVTQHAFRYIKEGNYRKTEFTYFDHLTDTVTVKTLSRKTGKYKTAQYYNGKDNMRDMIGGFLFLRVIDYLNFAEGDVKEIPGFFEDSFYDLKFKNSGLDNVKTKLGTISCIKLNPLMPNNDLFDGEDSIRTWISNDENHLPVKVEAKMFLGDAGIELIGVKNLKHPLTIKK